VFNDKEHIENTILSVIKQSYQNIEYIIIDGGSSDGTLDIIDRYRDNIDILESKPDRGLYDAMNNGLKLARGAYIWFLNSGDRIYSRDTVMKMVEGLSCLPDIMYGGTTIINEKGEEIGDRRLKPPDKLSWKSFKYGMLVCHQSVIVRKKIAPEYNLNYRISADIDWLIRTAKNAEEIHYTDLILSQFLEGGLSRTKVKQGLKERFRIMTRYYGFMPTFFRHFIFGMRLLNFYLKHKRI
jgi:glycosyltransferase involved in cell wall biosynthesis